MSGLSTLRCYLVVQAGTLVCGIVGPIFLFTYFAAQPDLTIRWMYWAGLFITAADVLIALAITAAMTRESATERNQPIAETSPRTLLP